MKGILLTTALFCAALTTSAQINIRVFNVNDVMNAKPIDKLLFTVQYQTSFIPDTLLPDKRIEETMMLKVGTERSVYYSYARFRTDSLIEADKAAGHRKILSRNI